MSKLDSDEKDYCDVCNSTHFVKRHRLDVGNRKTKALPFCSNCYKIAKMLMKLMMQQHGFVEYENIPKMVDSYRHVYLIGDEQ